MADFPGVLVPAQGFIVSAEAPTPAGVLVPAQGVLVGVGQQAAGAGAPPSIAFVSPTPGTAIASDDAIVLDVTDPDSSNVPTFLFVSLSTGAVEVVWDGGISAFTPFYSTSSRVVIADGHRYTLRRDSGWPQGTITFRANALDDTGGIAT